MKQRSPNCHCCPNLKNHAILMERSFDKIAEFTMARPVIKPKPGSFYLADKPAGAFLANILGFVAPFEFQKSVSLR